MAPESYNQMNGWRSASPPTFFVSILHSSQYQQFFDPISGVDCQKWVEYSLTLSLKPKVLILAPWSLDLFIILSLEPKNQEYLVNRRLLVNSPWLGRCCTLSFIKVFSYLSVHSIIMWHRWTYHTSLIFYVGKPKFQEVKSLHTFKPLAIMPLRSWHAIIFINSQTSFLHNQP